MVPPSLDDPRPAGIESGSGHQLFPGEPQPGLVGHNLARAAVNRIHRAAPPQLMEHLRWVSTCLLSSCLTSASARAAVYLNCACLKVHTCPFLSPPVRSCPEGGIGATRSEGVYFGVLQAHATTGIVGRGYA